MLYEGGEIMNAIIVPDWFLILLIIALLFHTIASIIYTELSRRTRKIQNEIEIKRNEIDLMVIKKQLRELQK